jgi:transposase
MYFGTIEGWIQTYKTTGIDKMVYDKPKNKKN